MSEHIRISDKAGIRTLTLSRPEKKNALTRAMYTALAEALEAAQENGDIRVCLLRAEGDAFTAGNDLMDFMNDPPRGDDSPVARFLKILLEMDKPLVVAVNGAAIGVGVTLLLHADLVVASREAEFRTAFVDLGLVPEAASSLIFPALAGHRRAAEWLMLGRTFSADEARADGVVNEVVAPDKVQARARELAGALAAKPPEGLQLTKRLMRRNRDALRDAMREEGRIFTERLTSDEARQAFMNFFESRRK